MKPSANVVWFAAFTTAEGEYSVPRSSMYQRVRPLWMGPAEFLADMLCEFYIIGGKKKLLSVLFMFVDCFDLQPWIAPFCVGTMTFVAVANKCEMNERRITMHVDFRQAGIGFAGKIVRT